jgi:long-subunit acyl-CoA synthetase (AMP-forming)
MDLSWTSDPTVNLEPRLASSGFGSVPSQTVIQVFQDTVAKHGNRSALFFKPALSGTLQQWKVWTWKNYWDDCVSFAKSLLSLNIDQFSVVNILGFNSVRILFCSFEIIDYSTQ